MNTAHKSTPKVEHDHAREEDLIDESGAESFPASDPPAVGRKPDKVPVAPPPQHPDGKRPG